MMPKMGHAPPRLGFKMGASTGGDMLPMIFPNFEVSPGQPNGPLKWPHFRQQIAAEDCSYLGRN